MQHRADDVQCRHYTTVLNNGAVDIKPEAVCEYMAGRWYDHETQICAGKELEVSIAIASKPPYADLCIVTYNCAPAVQNGEWTEAGCGDSGGPLFVREELTNEYVEVGVVSWGYGDAPVRVLGQYWLPFLSLHIAATTCCAVNHRSVLFCSECLHEGELL